MGDYRLGDFRNSGRLDFVGIGLGVEFSTGKREHFLVCSIRSREISARG
jgi:hypothetical protein